MLQKQSSLRLDGVTPLSGSPAESKLTARLQQLVVRSINTLETLLSSEVVSVQDRVTVALKILEVAGVTTALPTAQPSDQPSDQPSETELHQAIPPLKLQQSLASQQPSQPQQPSPDLPAPKGSHNVTLLLAGGHRYNLQLKTDEPLLHNLLKAVMQQAQAQEVFHGLFQIPIEQGRSALCFPSEQLVGVITEPPLVLQLREESEQPIEQTSATPQDASSHSLQPPRSTTSQFASPPSVFIPANYILLNDFLSPAENSQALQIALTKASDFLTSTTTTNLDGYRQSSLLYATLFPEFYDLLRLRILKTLPSVLQQLDYPTFNIGLVEMQLVAHNDGCYYKVHNDSGSEETATREISYVYYFHQEPKAFSGGELRIYDTEINNGTVTSRDISKTLVPRNNSIVFFDSRLQHEVMTVNCPSRAFGDSRFTLNGWLRRAEVSSR
jgi:SM-20-related protein